MKKQRSVYLIVVSMLGVALVTPARADWYWVPTQVTNAAAGDAILTSDPNGLIGTLLGSLGQYWSHTGMFIDSGYVIRHNTGDPNSLETEGSPIPTRINPGTLYAIKPGLISQRVPDAFGESGAPEFSAFDKTIGVISADGGGLNLTVEEQVIDRNAVILKKRGFADSASTYWASLQMLEYEAMYSFYSYTDVWTTEPDASDPDHVHVAQDLGRRNMCAGTVAWALYTGGQFNLWPWYYSEDVRDAAAPVLYRSIQQLVGTEMPNGLPFLGGIAAGLIGNALFSDAQDRIANQIVNCMAFEDCGNTGERWRGGVGDGASIAPDNLLPVGFDNPRGVAWGMSGWNPEDSQSSWYDTVEPPTYSGGYWKEY